MADSFSELVVKIGGQLDPSLPAATQKAGQQVNESIGKITAAASVASVALAGIAAGGLALAKSWVDASAQMTRFRGTLVAVMKDTAAADAALRKMVKFAATTPFDVPGVVEAGVQIKSLGQDVDALLPLAGDMAAVFGRSIPDAAQALAKAASGSQDGVQVLADSFGIARSKMIEFGAATDGSGGIMLRTKEQVDKLRGALIQIVKTDYAGAMAEQAKTVTGALSNMEDAFGRVAAQLGDELAPAVAAAAKFIGGVVEKFEALPKPIKAAVAWGTALTAGVAGVAAGLTGLVATVGFALPAIGSIGTALGVVAAGTTGAAAGIATLGATAPVVAMLALEIAGLAVVMAPVIAVFLAAQKIIADHTFLYEQLDKATLEASQRQIALSKVMRANPFEKSAAELAKVGITTRDVSKAITALSDRQEEIRNNEKLSEDQKRQMIAALGEEKQRLRGVNEELGAYLAAIGRLPELQKAAAKEFQDTEKRAKLQQAGTSDLIRAKEAEIALIQREIDALAEGSDKRKEAEAELLDQQVALYELRKQQSDAAQKDAESLRDAQVDAAKAEVDAAKRILAERERAGTATRADRAAITTAVKAAAKAEMDAEIAAIDAEEKARNKADLTPEAIEASKARRIAARRKYTDAVREATQEEAAMERAALQATAQFQSKVMGERIAAIDLRISRMQDMQSRGINVESSLAAARRERHAAALAQFDADTAAAIKAAEGDAERERIATVAAAKRTNMVTAFRQQEARAVEQAIDRTQKATEKLRDAELQIALDIAKASEDVGAIKQAEEALRLRSIEKIKKEARDAGVSEVDIARRVAAEKRKIAAQELADRKQIAEMLRDEVVRITQGQEAADALRIKRQVEKARAAGVAEADIAAWVAAKAQEAAEKKSSALEKVGDAAEKTTEKVRAVGKEFSRLGGPNSPLLSLEEMAAGMNLLSRPDQGPGGGTTSGATAGPAVPGSPATGTPGVSPSIQGGTIAGASRADNLREALQAPGLTEGMRARLRSQLANAEAVAGRTRGSITPGTRDFLGSLQGVDPASPQAQLLLAQMRAGAAGTPAGRTIPTPLTAPAVAGPAGAGGSAAAGAAAGSVSIGTLNITINGEKVTAPGVKNPDRLREMKGHMLGAFGLERMTAETEAAK